MSWSSTTLRLPSWFNTFLIAVDYQVFSRILKNSNVTVSASFQHFCEAWEHEAAFGHFYGHSSFSVLTEIFTGYTVVG